jgi:4-hydroxy-2-oxoglutarate aldolase
MLLQGLFPAITTPFYSDGAVYYRKLEHNVDRYSRTPINGLVVLGSTGEAVMLNDEERREVLKIACGFTAPEKVLIAGTGMESAQETLRLTEHAASLGYDVAMVRTPHFYRSQMNAASLLAFYCTVADKSPLPVIIYNVPPLTAFDIAAEVVIELAEHPNIIGMKESGGDLEKVKQVLEATKHIRRTVHVTEVFEAVTARMLTPSPEGKADGSFISSASLGGTAVAAPPKRKTRTKEVSFQVLTGNAHQLLESLRAGASGAVLAFAAAAPTAAFEVYAAWKDRNEKLADEKQTRIVDASKAIGARFGIPGLKYAMDLNGYYGGNPRLPQLTPPAEAKAEIEKLFADLKN